MHMYALSSVLYITEYEAMPIVYGTINVTVSTYN